MTTVFEEYLATEDTEDTEKTFLGAHFLRRVKHATQDKLAVVESRKTLDSSSEPSNAGIKRKRVHFFLLAFLLLRFSLEQADKSHSPTGETKCINQTKKLN